MDVEAIIPLRPHHGLCVQHYVGKGYDARFVENMNHITDILKRNPKQKVILRTAHDVLCDFCPNMKNSICESEKKVSEYDEKCLTLGGFHDGQIISWDLLQSVLYNKVIKSSKLKDVCDNCDWLSLCLTIKKEGC